MGKQSSRIIYRGKDIKDLVYQKKYLNKLYKGSNLVWEKLYRYFVRTSSLNVFDLDCKKYLNSTTLYRTYKLKKQQSFAIAILREIETEKSFFAISYDMLRWREIKDLEYINKINGFSSVYTFLSSYEGFFVYFTNQSGKGSELYFIEIESNLKYKVKKIYSKDIVFVGFSENGVSNYFFAIETFTSESNHARYNLCRISKNGDFLSKQLKGNFIRDNVNMARGGMKIIADGNGNAFIICYDVDAKNGGTVIFKVQNMDTEFVYTVFWARNSKILNGAVCGIDIVYDSFQTMFIAHRGFGKEPEFAENRSNADGGYYNMEFYTINSTGNVILVSEKINKEIRIKCFGIPERDHLTIKFGGFQGDGYKGADEEGVIYFYNVKKGLSSSTDSYTSSIFDYDKQETNPGFIGEFSWKDFWTSKYRSVVIFIDNLFFNESENNYVAVTEWEE